MNFRLFVPGDAGAVALGAEGMWNPRYGTRERDRFGHIMIEGATGTVVGVRQRYPQLHAVQHRSRSAIGRHASETPASSPPIGWMVRIRRMTHAS